MAKYMVQANYGQESLKGLLRDGGSRRREVVAKAAESLGATVESFYYALGENDLFVICEAPDSITTKALEMTFRAAAPFTMKISVLLTPEEMDEVAKKSPTYRGPGQ